MDIQPISFLTAKSSLDYFVKVFDLELNDELYKFHLYNLALQISMFQIRPEAALNKMAEDKGYQEMITDFADRYWELMQEVQNK